MCLNNCNASPVRTGIYGGPATPRKYGSDQGTYLNFKFRHCYYLRNIFLGHRTSIKNHKNFLFLSDNSYADADIQGAFSILDQDGDRRITASELKVLMSHMPVTELQNLVGEEDLDENGTLEYTEFLRWVKREALDALEKSTVEQEIEEVFNVLDSNGDGYLTPVDLQGLITDTKEANEMIREQDIDGDDRINYEEFVLLMSSR